MSKQKDVPKQGKKKGNNLDWYHSHSPTVAPGNCYLALPKTRLSLTNRTVLETGRLHKVVAEGKEREWIHSSDSDFICWWGKTELEKKKKKLG